MLGLVAVEGTRAPYIIAIEDQQYGGDRTRGEPSYVYRGAICVRRGASSVIANRQSEVLEMVNKAQQVTTDNSQPDEFLATCNYLDVESEGFGRHALSDRLVEAHPKVDTFGAEFVSAQSWVSFVFHPVDSGCEIDTVALKEKLRPNQRIGREGQWYHGVPRPFLDMFCNPRVTPREFLGTWQPRDAEGISHFVRIRPSGHIEVGCTYPLFLQREGIRFFGFVTLVGYLWQMVYLSRAIYHDAGFYGETAVLVNLVGTKGTRLADFARSQSGGWASPFSAEYWISTSPQQEMCHDQNIQIERRLLLADASDEEIETTIRDIARDLGAYYGQDRPRCFDYHTDEFPYRDYMQRS